MPSTRAHKLPSEGFPLPQQSAHTHGHDHSGHDHHDVFHTHAPSGKMRTAFLITLFILAAELTGGIVSHSLALLSDAGHVVTDLAAIGLSWYALKQAEKPSDTQMTYGYYRSGILAALMNALLLIGITVWILVEAYSRLLTPQPVHSLWMFISASVGLLLNLYMGLGMRSETDLSIRSAVLHMIGDAVASAAVILGGIVILFTHAYVIDPILSILISILIALGAWRILKQTLSILMEGTPRGIDFQAIVGAIQAEEGVLDVHDVHLWSITSGRNALSCHVVLDGGLTVRESQDILRRLEHRLAHQGIGHVTIQTEDADHPHGGSHLCATSEKPHYH